MTRKGFTLAEIMIVVAILALLTAIAVPNLLRARSASNETAAIAALKTISSAAHIYRSSHSGYPEGLADWYDDLTPPYIDGALAAGTKQGYVFSLVGDDVDALGNFQGFSATAQPLIPGKTGARYFFVDLSGVIRFSVTGEATVSDNPVE
jgi:type IV pilus assembly protein PilA